MKFSRQQAAPCMFVSVHLTGAYLFLSQTSTMGALSERDLCLSIYRMHHLHIFVVRPSAHGLLCGGISSENQCYHDWMYVAPTSACVRSPARSSHVSHLHESCWQKFAFNLCKLGSMQTHFSACWAGPPRQSCSLLDSIFSPELERLFVYQSESLDKTESDRVMNANFS